jgi:phospholipid:diacylglycerol acyltransferase
VRLSLSPCLLLLTANPAVGLLIGLTQIQPSNIHQMQTHLSLLMSSYDISFPELPDFDFSLVESEWQKIRSSIPEFWKLNKDGREFMVGEAGGDRGLSAEFPVVLIPGIVSTVASLFPSLSKYQH